MNFGSNKFRKIARIIVAAAGTFCFATETLAGPDQLDILGLIPGISELPQVKKAGIDPNSNSNNSIMLEIGGHKIPCAISFLGDKLASLGCITGKGSKKYEQYTEASNAEVHSTLTAGFTKKFGKPDSVIREPVRTRIGVEYEQQFVTWKDRRGNELQLVSMVGTVTEGMITFQSAEYIKQEAEKTAADEAKKKF